MCKPVYWPALISTMEFQNNGKTSLKGCCKVLLKWCLVLNGEWVVFPCFWIYILAVSIMVFNFLKSLSNFSCVSYYLYEVILPWNSEVTAAMRTCWSLYRCSSIENAQLYIVYLYIIYHIYSNYMLVILLLIFDWSYV